MTSDTADPSCTSEREIANPVGATRATIYSPDETALRHILIATDATPGAEGALRVADLIARRSAATVELLTVFEPLLSSELQFAVDPPRDKIGKFLARTQAQLRNVVGERPSWRVGIEHGPVAGTIRHRADAHRADLIVLGLGHHRVLETEMALQIARRTAVPVLAVPQSMKVLPTKVMLALDFSYASIRAAHAALNIMATPGVVHLVYVHMDDEPFPREPASAAATYTSGFDSFFDALEIELAHPRGVSFERIVIGRGDPATALLACASANSVDVIAVGNHGRTLGQRLRLGSVSTRIIRAAPCAVLVTRSGRPPTV